ncbi:hypothetical protein RRG08_023690 [Elysia crispata]|uniref:Uncharacterized protein n=1 Tax=Elysia crispata TaxID=231223 RepID=A0AAE1ALG7_9GAST|nr:hypothetical protein RRG08_023690 [Elysia crispata]
MKGAVVSMRVHEAVGDVTGYGQRLEVLVGMKGPVVFYEDIGSDWFRERVRICNRHASEPSDLTVPHLQHPHMKEVITKAINRASQIQCYYQLHIPSLIEIVNALAIIDIPSSECAHPDLPLGELILFVKVRSPRVGSSFRQPHQESRPKSLSATMAALSRAPVGECDFILRAVQVLMLGGPTLRPVSRVLG